MIRDLTEYSIMNLKRRGLRSWLTVIGIVIGIFSVVIMISIAQGLENKIKSELSLFGDDVISIQPIAEFENEPGGGLFFGPKGQLTENDLEALRNLPDIKNAGASIEGRADVEYRNKNISLYIWGGDRILLEEMYHYELDSGRLMYENERGVAILGYDLANDTFDEQINIGRRIKVNNKSFTVIGILKKSGSMITAMADNMVIIPRNDAREIISDFKGNRLFTEIDVQIAEGVNISEAEERINQELFRLHKVNEDNKDFSTMSAVFIEKHVNEITMLLRLFLGGIAAISLLVGGIGIANTMFTSVMEKTKEIGILKAVGATNGMITNIVLIEAGIIGLVGGIIGLILSVIASNAINHFGVPSDIKIEVISGVIFFSFAIGVIAGYIPAKNAAKCDVVEALRFE
ncbi:MAG: ABC transporter permease [Candidatus Micrarchaeota archaeon]